MATKVNQETFDIAKRLLQNINKSKAADALGLSSATMSYIARSATYSDYREVIKIATKKSNAAARARKKQAAGGGTTTITPTPPNEVTLTPDKAPEILLAHIEAMHDILKAHTSMLGAVNDKLDLVVVPKRRFF